MIKQANKLVEGNEGTFEMNLQRALDEINDQKGEVKFITHDVVDFGAVHYDNHEYRLHYSSIILYTYLEVQGNVHKQY